MSSAWPRRRGVCAASASSLWETIAGRGQESDEFGRGAGGSVFLAEALAVGSIYEGFPPMAAPGKPAPTTATSFSPATAPHGLKKIINLLSLETLAVRTSARRSSWRRRGRHRASAPDLRRRRDRTRRVAAALHAERVGEDPARMSAPRHSDPVAAEKTPSGGRPRPRQAGDGASSSGHHLLLFGRRCVAQGRRTPLRIFSPSRVPPVLRCFVAAECELVEIEAPRSTPSPR